MEFKIDLSDGKIEEQKAKSRRDLEGWLAERRLTLDSVTSSLDDGIQRDVFVGLAVMDIEIEAAIRHAREHETSPMAYFLAQAMRTKDFIYDRLIQGLYGGDAARVLSRGISPQMALWRDYLKQRHDGAVNQGALVLGGSSR